MPILRSNINFHTVKAIQSSIMFSLSSSADFYYLISYENTELVLRGGKALEIVQVCNREHPMSLHGPPRQVVGRKRPEYIAVSNVTMDPRATKCGSKSCYIGCRTYSRKLLSDEWVKLTA